MADADIPVPVTFNAVLEGTEVENHTAEWYHRITTSGDPVIRARTHNSGPYVDHALYFEDEVSGNSDANTFRSDNGGINLRVRRIRQTSCAYRSQQNDNQQRRRLGRWSHRSPAIHATSGDGRRPGQSRLKHDQVADHRLEPSGTCRIRTLLYIIYFRCYLFRTGKTSCLVSNKC